MPTVTLHGTVFAGTPFDAESVPRMPQQIVVTPKKPGVTLTADDGTERVVVRGTGTPREHLELSWTRVPNATRVAVRAVFDLAASFTAVVPSGAYLMQCGLEDYRESINITLPGNVDYYDVTLRIHQA